ncbi:MAG: hypothetical protein U0N50_04980 [Christensenellales bacterium]
MGKPYRYTFYVDKDVRERFSDKCWQEGIGTSEALALIIETFLKDEIEIRKEFKVVSKINKEGRCERDN